MKLLYFWGGASLKAITFIDTEIEPNSGKILDIGSVKADGAFFHSNSVLQFISFIQGSQYICGHNIISHDLKYIYKTIDEEDLKHVKFIDTLYLSPLLFPCKPYHSLVKDDKLQSDELNNPVNDSKKARDLFADEVATFFETDDSLKSIYYFLLKDKLEFKFFFHYVNYVSYETAIEPIIRKKFKSRICENAKLTDLINNHPIELAYCLALINTSDRYSITPPWVIKNYPEVQRIMFLLRNRPCLEGCLYCDEVFDIKKGLKRFFGFDSFRTYDGEPLQEKAVEAAVNNQSLLSVFPTGGGKSVTFQLPALMSGENERGLTVVISPLQSLMKDQVDNLERISITEAVTINGLLDPIERAKSFERVENGYASILYISPESLRSKSIEQLLLERNVVRFVIDEAHCFSAWGQDFRVDYLYIGDFIKSLQEKKNLSKAIPVSCFTATAKRNVIDDICAYFKEKLSIDMQVYSSTSSRTNLKYRVIESNNDEEKYNTVRDLVESKNCPTIIYVSRTHNAEKLAERLVEDGYTARPYHGKMDKTIKTANQDAFINGEIQIMVATSAFGMGVDKKDVGMVIHYNISDSIENYVQEAGRAGRDASISADCYVLFSDDDLDKHFTLLNQTKITIKEIQQVWKAIKDLTVVRKQVSQSALEIARKAGWEENVTNLEMRVKTAIAALENAGYLRRGQNMPRVYADSILSKNFMEAVSKINNSNKFNDKQKVQASRIIQSLISSKNTKNMYDEAESRVDYIADRLAIPKDEVIRIIYILREEDILADAKDLSAFIKRKANKNRSLELLKSYRTIEGFLLDVLDFDEEKVFNIKGLNELAEEKGFTDVTSNKMKKIINIWSIKNWIKRKPVDFLQKHHLCILSLYNKEELEQKLTKRHELAQFIIEYLYEKGDICQQTDSIIEEKILVEFSILELQKEFQSRLSLYNTKVSIEEIEDALFYLSKTETIKIEGGFLVTYNALTINRIEDRKKRYKIEDYQQLKHFYDNKVQQIHIVGEYAQKMIDNYKGALQFVDDYFQLNYSSFLNKYFNGSRQDEIKRTITPAKFKQLFGQLSPAQLMIINDKLSKHIVVAAGPGSGKTRVLVHKLASLLMMEDVKHEQLLMVTFSRAAATEFKKRLLSLYGNAANFIEIKTFHSYCFDLLGKVGTLEKSKDIIKEAVDKIRAGEVETSRITKTVLVIDEAQDMDAYEFELIEALIEHNEEMRVIAVGDDDQSIYQFRGSSSEYMKRFITEYDATLYELVDNYRSKANIVDFSNQFLVRIPNRLKQTPIMPIQSDNGKIKVVKYKGYNLITPLMDAIISEELSGSTCVLVNTNDDALQITGLLTEKGIKAKLIQSNDGFSLYNLLEIRYLIDQLKLSDKVSVISEESWKMAKRNLIDTYLDSPNLEICIALIKEFETANPKRKYRSDLEIFIRESKLEDFYKYNSDTINVSTICKAKGREFDNVFLMLNQDYDKTRINDRQLYVAMTRAKEKLIIHYNGDYLDSIKSERLETITDTNYYNSPYQLAMQLTHRDVWLDYFTNTQETIEMLNSGDKLNINGYACLNVNDREVLKFSKQFKEKVEIKKRQGYFPKSAKIRFILYWEKEGLNKEMKITLPEIYFERDDSGFFF